MRKASERIATIQFLLNRPVEYARMVGFTKLTELHNRWIRDMVSGEGDRTLQAHRGAYKTTGVSVALDDIMILFPNVKIAFFRKTDNDVKEVVSQVRRILEHPVTRE